MSWSAVEAFEYPVELWGRADLIQAHHHAVDPRDGKNYLFVAQAARSERPGRPESVDIHRHVYTRGVLRYVDSMRCVEFGHTSSFHVRISDAGNPWLWLPVETFRRDGTLATRVPVRTIYQGGARRTLDAATSLLQMRTNATSDHPNQAPVSCPPWRVALRESRAATELYRLFAERSYSTVAKPLKVSPLLPRPDMAWQGSCVTERSIFRVYGMDDEQVCFENDWSGRLLRTLDVSKLRPATGVGSGTDDWHEPEGPCVIGRSLHLIVKFGSFDNRRLVSFAAPL